MLGKHHEKKCVCVCVCAQARELGLLLVCVLLDRQAYVKETKVNHKTYSAQCQEMPTGHGASDFYLPYQNFQWPTSKK